RNLLCLASASARIVGRESWKVFERSLSVCLFGLQIRDCEPRQVFNVLDDGGYVDIGSTRDLAQRNGLPLPQPHSDTIEVGIHGGIGIVGEALAIRIRVPSEKPELVGTRRRENCPNQRHRSLAVEEYRPQLQPFLVSQQQGTVREVDVYLFDLLEGV